MERLKLSNVILRNKLHEANELVDVEISHLHFLLLQCFYCTLDYLRLGLFVFKHAEDLLELFRVELSDSLFNNTACLCQENLIL